MKILKKSLALFLIVALFASMSIMAFAEFDYSTYASGTFEKKTWNATLKFQNNRTTATAEMSWYGNGTVSISWYSFRHVNSNTGAKGYITTPAAGAQGSVRVSRNAPKGSRFNELIADYKIRTKLMKTLVLGA